MSESELAESPRVTYPNIGQSTAVMGLSSYDDMTTTTKVYHKMSKWKAQRQQVVKRTS